MFGCLPFVKPCGRQVDQIDRRHSKLEQVPDEVLHSFRTLEECRLDANQIKELPKNFFRLERIRYLTLSDNDLTEIPNGLGKFSHLIELDISRNDISILPDTIRFCDSLQIVDISNNPLQNLPPSFCQLLKLRVLCMNDISLNELPPDFGNLQFLEKCELRDNRLSHLPESFGQLSRLEFLDLGANEFRDLPPLIGQLSNLCELWMDDNELKSLPPELGNMKRLQQLDLSENVITALPDEISGLISLCDLNLSQNNLNYLPDSFGQLKKLTVLKLNQNQLLALTASIGSCSNLQELYLTENFLPSLPPTMGNLDAMFLLNVDQNQLTEVPFEIGLCTSLNILSLRENLLLRLPKEIGSCSRLRVLDVSGNRLQRLPITLAQCPLTALWLSSNQSQPVITLQRDEDEASGEEFLTCYLLPQDQLNSQTELDPTMSPSELTSFTGPLLPAVFDRNLPMHNTDDIPTEPNYAYEPVQVPLINDGNQPSHWVGPGMPRPTSVISSTTSGTHSPSAPVSPDGEAGRSPHFSPRASISTHSGEMDTSMSRVHFSTGVTQQDDSIDLKTKSGRISPTSPSNLEGPPYDGLPYGNTVDTWRIPNGSSPTNELAGVDSRDIPRMTPEARWKLTNTDTGPSGATSMDVSDQSTTTPHAKPRRKVLNMHLTPDNPEPLPEFVGSSVSSSGSVHYGTDNVQPGFNHAKDDANSDDNAYSSGGEEICVISRRVGFTDDVEDNEEKSNQKLIRRDTPHYTKRARIQSKTAEGVDSEEAVLKILEKYRTSAVPTSGINAGSFTVLSGSSGVGSLQSNQPIWLRQERITVNIHRQPGSGLGLSIAGGVGSIPYRGSDQGIFVSRLNQNGLAFASGLRLNDKILEVNGVSLANVEHQLAVTALRANTDDFQITVSRDIYKSNERVTAELKNAPSYSTLSTDHHSNPTIKCLIHREPSGLGFSIAGGRGAVTPVINHEKITISKITPGSAADKCGKLRVGDQIVKINGIEVKDARHDQVITLLTGSSSPIELEVSRPTTNPSADTPTTKNGHGTSHAFDASKRVSAGSRQPHYFTGTKESWLGSTGSGLTTGSSSQPVHLRTEQGYPVDLVTVQLNGGPLGLAIYGGSDINCLPFGGTEPGIFISKISSEGAAQYTGLRIGDRILRVNDMDLRRATHDEAVRALIQTNKELKLEVRRDPSPPGLRRLTISRRVNERFGLRIAGGISAPPSDADSLPGHLSRLSNDGSIFVTWVSPDGAIGRDGRLKPGDRLLEVNGQWVMGSTLEEALEVFRKAGPSLNLVVCDGPLDVALKNQCDIRDTQNKQVSNTTGRLSGSTVDRSDDLPDNLISSSAYSDAKRQFLSYQNPTVDVYNVAPWRIPVSPNQAEVQAIPDQVHMAQLTQSGFMIYSPVPKIFIQSVMSRGQGEEEEEEETMLQLASSVESTNSRDSALVVASPAPSCQSSLLIDIPSVNS